MRCSQCDAFIPENGKFCIECGAPASTAVTTATERLPDYAGGVSCAACGTRNPAGATFCVTCGNALAARPVATASAPTIAPSINIPEPIVTAQPARSVAPSRGGFSPAIGGGVSGGLFLIGIAVLAITGWWWPGIIVLIGLTSLVTGLWGGQSEGARAGAIQGAFFLLGMAVIAQFNWWWPGMLVLVGLIAITNTAFRRKH